jgi:outer membrane protein OmpA-like peptidoglycan-associated protein
MNKRLNVFTCLVLLLASNCLTAQDKKTKRAEEDFSNYAYATAIDAYEELVDKGYSNEEIYMNLGDANYLNAKYDTASDWYSKLFMVEGADIDPEYMYRYAQSLKSTGEYTASDTWMKKFNATRESDLRSKKFVENLDYLKEIEKQSGRYDIKNLGLNSTESDFAPSFQDKNLIFSSARDSGIATKKIHEWTNKGFLNLYKASPTESGDFSSAMKLPKAMNKKTHESSTAFTKDGSTVYFTRNNSQNGKFARDEGGVSRLKIYKATLENGEWKDIIELPFNGDAHSAAHPTLSADESKLYFASDMAGSLGESDIFVVDINSDGSFGLPINLGDQINTEARETFPFITASNVLYFASDGHPGLGGLDIFATRIDDLDDIYIVNIGKSVNSQVDDFSFIIDESNKKGFFASNRDGGKGSDDIYSFVEQVPIDLSCNTLVTGVVKDMETGQPLEGAKVAIFDSENQIVAETVAAGNGSFSLEGDCRDGEYYIKGSQNDYDDGNSQFTLVNKEDTHDVEVLLPPIRKAAPAGTDLAKYLDLEPIYFDFDKWHIREDAKQSIQKVIAYMKEYPIIKVKIGSHTDSRASKAYNLRLSNKRANKTMEYVIEQGIDPLRVTALGLGETMLTNHCIDDVACTKRQHQENRRSEFIVVE